MPKGAFNYIFAAPGATTVGTAGADWITSGGGKVYSGGGNDVVMGQAGDHLNGQGGNDSMHYTVGSDVFSWTGFDFYGAHLPRGWNTDPDHKGALSRIWANVNQDQFRFFAPGEVEVTAVQEFKQSEIGFGYKPNEMGINVIRSFDLTLTVEQPGKDYEWTTRVICNDDVVSTPGNPGGNAAHLVKNAKGMLGEGDRLVLLGEDVNTQAERIDLVEQWLETSDFLL